MALGCACKLYTLHTVGYRNNIRLSQTVQSAAAAAASAAPLLSPQTNETLPVVAQMPSNHSTSTNLSELNTESSGLADTSSSMTRPLVQPNHSALYNSLTALFRRSQSASRTEPSNQIASSTPSNENGSNPAANSYQFNFGGSTVATNPSNANSIQQSGKYYFFV